MLGKTLGVPLFQEQAMRESSFARVIATFSAVGTRVQSIESEDHGGVGKPEQLQRHPERC